jgi:hypothetical protein
MPRAKNAPVGAAEVKPEVKQEPTLTEQQRTLGAVNDPDLSKDEFELNGNKYKFVHLSYDFYLEFMFKIKPLLAGVVGAMASKSKSTINLPGIELMPSDGSGVNGILTFCKDDIPDMVRIIVNNYLEADGREAEKISATDIRKFRGNTPMSLTRIIMGQVVYNNLIGEFGAFFVESLPLLNAMGLVTPPPAPKATLPPLVKLTTKATHSS